MQSRVEQADANHERLFNCAQSVACAYADLVDSDRTLVFRLAEGLGAGLGGRKGTCGALLGACAVAGLANSDGNTEAPASKKTTYQIASRIYDRFEGEVGSTICEVIRNEGGEPLTSCEECVRIAARIVEEELFSE